MDNLKKFKRDAENIPIPEIELNRRIKEAITKGSQHNRKPFSKRIIPIVSIASVVFILVISSAFVSPTMAKVLSQIPYLQAVLPFQDEGLKQVDSNELIHYIGQTVSDNDIAVTITDIYYDEVRLAIGYTIPLDGRDYENDFIMNDVDLLIDGYSPMSYNMTEEKIDNMVVGTITTFSRLPDEFDLFIQFNQAFDQKGNWEFRIPVKKVKGGQLFELEQTVEKGDLTITAKRLYVTPSASHLEMNIGTYQELENSSFNNIDSFVVYDGNGERLDTITFDYTSGHIPSFDKYYYNGYLTFIPIQEMDVITVVPISTEGSVKELSELAITISLDELEDEPIPETTNYELVSDAIDKQTFYSDKMIEKVANYLQINEGSFEKANIRSFDYSFTSDFYKEQDFSLLKDVSPVALLDDKEGYFFYKKNDGQTYIWVISQDDMGEWVLSNKMEFGGLNLQQLKNEYNQMLE